MLFGRILKSRALFNIAEIGTCMRYAGNNVTAKKRLSCRTFATEATCSTIGEIIDRWSRRFEKEGIPEPVESIQHIVAHIIGTNKLMDVLNVSNKSLTAEQIETVESLCECRLLRMPVQYIIGEWDFRDITLKLVPPVFIPRPETEILVDFVLKRVNASQKEKYEILEIGCGSGAISLALAHACEKLECTAIDANLYACELTKENRDKLGLENRVSIMHATLGDEGTVKVSRVLAGSDSIDLNSKLFDFIVSNPPYVPTKNIPELAPEIRIYEDLRALDGGDDGLKIIKPLLKYSAVSLKPGGRLLIEVDPSHPEYIKFFTNKYPVLKLQYEHTYKDFCNNDRFVEIVKV